MRRTGVSVVQPAGRGTAVPGIRRPLRAAEFAADQQSAVQRMGADIPGRADDSGVTGSLDTSVSHLRDEW